jgi:hypothetical protein
MRISRTGLDKLNEPSRKSADHGDENGTSLRTSLYRRLKALQEADRRWPA